MPLTPTEQMITDRTRSALLQLIANATSPAKRKRLIARLAEIEAYASQKAAR